MNQTTKTGSGAPLLWAVVSLLASFLGALYVIETHHPTVPLSLVVVLVPIAAFAWFLVAELRALRRLDELQQRIQLEAFAVAYPCAILLVFAVGFLERAGISIPGFTNLRDVWPLAIIPYWVGVAIAQRRYR